MSTRLFLIFALCFYFLAKCLAERKFRFAEHNVYFISCLQLADNDFELLIADAVK